MKVIACMHLCLPARDKLKQNIIAPTAGARTSILTRIFMMMENVRDHSKCGNHFSTRRIFSRSVHGKFGVNDRRAVSLQ